MPKKHSPTEWPSKTRTQWENQERAYIAASRRSDRSLAARIRSAQCASEVHKQLTGRALYICEEEMANLETYKEMDKGMPDHYEDLTAVNRIQNQELDRQWKAFVLDYLVAHPTNDSGVAHNENVAPSFTNGDSIWSLRSHEMYQPCLARSESHKSGAFEQNISPPLPDLQSPEWTQSSLSMNDTWPLPHQTPGHPPFMTKYEDDTTFDNTLFTERGLGSPLPSYGSDSTLSSDDRCQTTASSSLVLPRYHHHHHVRSQLHRQLTPELNPGISTLHTNPTSRYASQQYVPEPPLTPKHLDYREVTYKYNPNGKDRASGSPNAPPPSPTECFTGSSHL